MATACVVGSTGLVGGHILTTILDSPSFNRVHAYTRRELASNPKLSEIRSADTASWPGSFPKDTSIFFSGLGTTRAQAGGFANQRKIDLDLNVELAKAAKQAGVKTYVLISGGQASSKSMFPYMKLKGEVEDAVVALDFDHCVIVRPGLILGGRDHLRFAEWALQRVAIFLGGISPKLQEGWAQDATVIARAAVVAGRRCIDQPTRPRIEYVEQADVLRLGKTEWKAE